MQYGFLTCPCAAARLRRRETCTNRPIARRTAPTMKRKRPASQPASAPPPLPLRQPTPAPARISPSSSPLSLRQQLAAARIAAAAAAEDADDAPGKPRARTKFRRKKTGFSDMADVGVDDLRALRRARGEGLEQDVPDGKYDLSGPLPMMLVDAYNVVGAWKKLVKLRNRGDMDGARVLLVEEVAEFAGIRGWSCEIVFDAHGNKENVKKEEIAGVDVVFTGNETADTWIERRVFELCEAGERQVWVATNDVAERQFAESKGAHVMSAGLFVQEIKRAKKESREHAEDLRKFEEATVAGNMLIRNVNEETREKLYRLRELLDNNGGGGSTEPKI
jgi:uncharacterized protein